MGRKVLNVGIGAGKIQDVSGIALDEISSNLQYFFSGLYTFQNVFWGQRQGFSGFSVPAALNTLLSVFFSTDVRMAKRKKVG